jgi:MOSC domain-containing protein YiiM
VTARVISVNVARVRPNPFKPTDVTGMEKHPVTGPVHVRAPGAEGDGRGSGLVGDTIGDRAHHGGDDQAVYAYAREELDGWQEVLGRALPDGAFGENLTTTDLDVSGALVGERWRIGSSLELQVTSPRIPCSTFRGWIGVRGWLKTFARAALPGAYLSVVTPGNVQAGDTVEIAHRPDHDVSVTLMFRALLLEPELLPSLLVADDLPPEIRRLAQHWASRLGR